MCKNPKENCSLQNTKSPKIKLRPARKFHTILSFLLVLNSTDSPNGKQAKCWINRRKRRSVHATWCDVYSRFELNLNKSHLKNGARQPLATTMHSIASSNDHYHCRIHWLGVNMMQFTVEIETKTFSAHFFTVFPIRHRMSPRQRIDNNAEIFT